MNNKPLKKVFVGLSGGVDSAVSAALLKQEGYDVTGVYMKNWSGDDYGIQENCPWEIDQADAEKICKHLNISFRSFNFEKEYRDAVVEYFFKEYEKGRTPNPDVMCNKEIKFKLFLNKSLENGADLIATGHYARTIQDNSIFHLYKGSDINKDQTYFLYNITQEQLSKTLFPIGNLIKPQVRILARNFNLPNSEKPDSQGICFIGEINVHKFLMSRIPEKKGKIIDIDTDKIVGEHSGVYFYTLGQREGLHIGGESIPYFVVDKHIENNIVYVGHGNNHSKLLKSIVELENLHLISVQNLVNKETRSHSRVEIDMEASIRYRHKPRAGKLSFNVDVKDGELYFNKIYFKFNEPQRAITSGQSLVLYLNDECIGGGIIK